MKKIGKVVKTTAKGKNRPEQLPPRTDPQPRPQPRPPSNGPSGNGKTKTREVEAAPERDIAIRAMPHHTVEGLVRTIGRNPTMTSTDIAEKLYTSETPWPLVKFIEVWQDKKVGVTATTLIQIVLAYQILVREKGPRAGDEM